MNKPVKPKRQVRIFDMHTNEEIRAGEARNQDFVELGFIKSLFGLSRDTVVKLAFALVGCVLWYANNENFKNTVNEYMKSQKEHNVTLDEFVKNSDTFHSSVFKTPFTLGQPRNQNFTVPDKNFGYVNKEPSS